LPGSTLCSTAQHRQGVAEVARGSRGVRRSAFRALGGGVQSSSAGVRGQVWCRSCGGSRGAGRAAEAIKVEQQKGGVQASTERMGGRADGQAGRQASRDAGSDAMKAWPAAANAAAPASKLFIQSHVVAGAHGHDAVEVAGGVQHRGVALSLGPHAGLALHKGVLHKLALHQGKRHAAGRGGGGASHARLGHEMV